MEEKIDKYVRNAMNAAEKSAFEAEIAKQADLAATVKVYQAEYKAMDLLVETDLKLKMSNWEDEITLMNAPPIGMTVKKSPYKRLYWALSAAAILVLGLVGWWFLKAPTAVSETPVLAKETPTKPNTPSQSMNPIPKPGLPKPSPRVDIPKIAEQESRPPTKTPTPLPVPNKPPPPTRVPPPDYQALAATYYNNTEFIKKTAKPSKQAPMGIVYGQALDSYTSGQYQEAAKLLKTLLKANPNEVQSRELLAHTLYKSGKHAEAIPYLRRLAGAGSNASAQRADWALALAYLRQMPAQKTLLTQYLNKINANPRHLYHAQAKRLAGDLGF